MPIAQGQQAPDFTLYTSDRETWTLSEQEGPSVLLFFPGAFTSVCTAEMCSVNDDLARYRDLGANVVGISTDAPGALAAFKSQNRLDFPLLSDHDAEVAEAYGAKMDRSTHPMGYGRLAKRAAFVVGADGAVRYAEVLDSPLNQPDFDAVRAALGA